jgi:hypothetical protein
MKPPPFPFSPPPPPRDPWMAIAWTVIIVAVVLAIVLAVLSERLGTA